MRHLGMIEMVPSEMTWSVPASSKTPCIDGGDDWASTLPMHECTTISSVRCNVFTGIGLNSLR